jgi:Zinc finger, C3HC4 type (RING finger)
VPASPHTLCASFAETMLPLKRGRDEQSAEEGGIDAGAGSGPRRSAAATLDAVLALMQSDFSCSVCHGLVVAPHILACSHRFCGNCILEWTERDNNTCPECREDIEQSPVLERGLVRFLLFGEAAALCSSDPPRRTSFCPPSLRPCRAKTQRSATCACSTGSSVDKQTLWRRL